MENLTKAALSKRHKTTMKVSARNYVWTALLAEWAHNFIFERDRERERDPMQILAGINVYSIMLNSAERVEEQEEL